MSFECQDSSVSRHEHFVAPPNSAKTGIPHASSDVCASAAKRWPKRYKPGLTALIFSSGTTKARATYRNKVAPSLKPRVSAPPAFFVAAAPVGSVSSGRKVRSPRLTTTWRAILVPSARAKRSPKLRSPEASRLFFDAVAHRNSAIGRDGLRSRLGHFIWHAAKRHQHPIYNHRGRISGEKKACAPVDEAFFRCGISAANHTPDSVSKGKENL